MSNTNIRRFKWTLLALPIFLILVGLGVSNRGVTARVQEDITIVLSVEDDNSGIKYAVAVDNITQEALARIEYPTTIQGIEQYRNFNDQELSKILQNGDKGHPVPLKITFNSPLSEEKFTQFVKQYDIEVAHYVIYMLDSDGKIVTVQGSPMNGELVPTALFNTATNSISQEYSHGARLLGWVEVTGVVELMYVFQLSNDIHVFLADVMRMFLESQLTDEALANAGIVRGTRRNLINSGFAEIYQRPLAWDLYHLGLMELVPHQP
jgi:hypothetical protein